MHIFGGTVTEAAARVADPAFVAECAETYAEIHGRPPGEAEQRSWSRSWPSLLRILSAAELGDLHLLLEYELPGTSQRIDALLLGHQAAAKGLTSVVIELKQWTHARPHAAGPGMLQVGERAVLHPARQVGGYVNYLNDWLPAELDLEVEGVALLHEAPPDLIAHLRERLGSGPSASYPVLGAQDLSLDAAPHVLAERLRCSGLRMAAPERITAFLDARHRPSPKLLAKVAANIAGSESFRLIGEQDKARQLIYQAIRAGRGSHDGHVVVVTGGPGTGKTAIALRLLGDLCGHPEANPRLLSPSATLTQQLNRAAGELAKGLIATWTSGLPRVLDKDRSVVLLDEAHRARTGRTWRRAEFPDALAKLLENCAVLVLFLDEDQIVRPGEGTTVDELRRMAARMNHSFECIDLPTQFRCSGSRAYMDWLDALFSPGGHPPRWAGADYDLALADSPVQLEEWVAGHIRREHSARITAGYCWPWDSSPEPPLSPEVSLSWSDASGEHRWARPWNSKADRLIAGEGVPGRAFWATDEGGQRQVGCVYTAQGMEYDYSAVILGKDITRTAHGWQARPEESHDPALRSLTPQEYLPYALNTYRVLATRGVRGTRLYSDDAATQQYLRTVLPNAPS
ncbi:DNA/RNA helicase domain-containing protein [Streptomyces sparsogenes]|uniref:DNA/RNA helicase domain-containing protein n=1 Tax=Streptomyces sparsogenes TaxID=67365 RepID=UPI0033DE97A6